MKLFLSLASWDSEFCHVQLQSPGKLVDSPPGHFLSKCWETGNWFSRPFQPAVSVASHQSKVTGGHVQAWLTAKPRLSPQRAPSYSPDTPYPNPACTLTSTAPFPVLSLLECPCFFLQDRPRLPSPLRSFPSSSLPPADLRLLCVSPAPWTCGSRLGAPLYTQAKIHRFALLLRIPHTSQPLTLEFYKYPIWVLSGNLGMGVRAQGVPKITLPPWHKPPHISSRWAQDLKIAAVYKMLIVFLLSSSREYEL